jgi:hypothetical protein
MLRVWKYLSHVHTTLPWKNIELLSTKKRKSHWAEKKVARLMWSCVDVQPMRLPAR